MISKIDKNTVRQKRHARVRKTITGTAETPRMNVYRSLNHIYPEDAAGVPHHAQCLEALDAV